MCKRGYLNHFSVSKEKLFLYSNLHIVPSSFPGHELDTCSDTQILFISVTQGTVRTGTSNLMETFLADNFFILMSANALSKEVLL